MSFNDIKPYIEERMASVDADFREWNEPFDQANIPSSIMDKSWSLKLNPATYSGSAQTCFSFNCPVTLHVYIKGYREPHEAVDTAWKLADSIITATTEPAYRLTQPNIKNVLPGVVAVNPITDDNDNAIVLELTFNFKVII